MGQFRSLYESDENATYEGFVVRNNAGDDPTLTDIAGFGWLTTSIAKSTEVPDKLIKLIHFLYSEEGQHTAHFGFEGETFNYVDGGRRIEWVPAFEALSPEERSQTYGTGFMLQMDWVSVMNMFPPPAEEWNFTSTDEYEMKAVGLPYSYDGKSIALRTNPDDPRNDDMRTLETAINSFWSKQLPKMITAESVRAARAVWQESVAELDAMGLPELIDYNNDRFQGTKEALGIDFSWPPNRR